ncbi:MAG TPA: rod shape-determining protein MreD [Candidatus Baltobacteraceae bacterium]|jgi:rod shape-determining protein MreD
MLLSFRNSAAQAHAVRVPTHWRAAAIWLLAAGFFQATLVHYIAFRGVVPSLIFLVVATYALRAGAAGAIILGAAGGLLEDALCGNTGAAWTIATTISALAISGAARLTFAESPSIFAAMVVVAALVREGLYWAVLSLEGFQVGLGMHYTKIAIASALYTAVIAMIVIWARWRFVSR